MPSPTTWRRSSLPSWHTMATTSGTETSMVPSRLWCSVACHGAVWCRVVWHGDRVASPYSTPPRLYHGDLQIYYVHYAYASIYAFHGHVHRRKRGSPWLVLGSRQHMSRGTITAMQIPARSIHHRSSSAARLTNAARYFSLGYNEIAGPADGTRVINYFAAVNRPQ